MIPMGMTESPYRENFWVLSGSSCDLWWRIAANFTPTKKNFEILGLLIFELFENSGPLS